jgi:transposase
MDKDQEIEQLKAALGEAMQTIAQLTQQVQELEARLAKDSHNSHLPPSSDRFARQPKSLRKKSEKPTGGQKGHPGHHLQMVETPDQVLVRSPQSCSFCQQSLTEEPIDHVVRRQVFDVSMPQLCVTEYQLQSKRCPCCQALTLAPCPAQVSAPVQYGPSVAALAVYLSQVQLLPDQRICHLLFEVMGLPVSSGSIHQWIARCAKALQPVEEAIKSALRAAPVLHQDETGLYEQGQRRWMHVCSTPLLTHYAVHPKRGREAMDAIGIAPAFTGISVHDGWESYQGYSCSHALCNVHHLRELTFVEETYHQDWASDLKALLLEMKRTCEQARATGQTRVDPTVRTRLVARYETLIQQGLAANPPDPPLVEGKRGRPRQHPARCLLMRLHTHQEQVLAFLHHLNVPFSNSQAERDIRMVKVQQKVSGCFRSEEGATFFCRIRGYVSTMQKQGAALLSLLEAALTGSPVFPAF